MSRPEPQGRVSTVNQVVCPRARLHDAALKVGDRAIEQYLQGIVDRKLVIEYRGRAVWTSLAVGDIAPDARGGPHRECLPDLGDAAIHNFVIRGCAGLNFPHLLQPATAVDLGPIGVVVEVDDVVGGAGERETLNSIALLRPLAGDL